MTLQDLGGGEYLLRLAHQFAIGEDSSFSKPVQVNFNNLFVFPIRDVKEVSLTTNRDVQDLPHFNINGDEKGANFETFKTIPFAADSVIINPMDIRTFIFKKA